MMDARAMVLEALLDDNERLERENIELRRDLLTVREMFRASVDLNYKFRAENATLRAYTKRLRAATTEWRAA